MSEEKTKHFKEVQTEIEALDSVVHKGDIADREYNLELYLDLVGDDAEYECPPKLLKPNKDENKDEQKDTQTNTIMKENIKGHIKGHNKTLKCEISSLTDNEDIDVFDLSSIEEGNENEQLEKLADQIYKCINKNKPSVLENNIPDRLVEKSSKSEPSKTEPSKTEPPKSEPKHEQSSGLDLERVLEKIKKPIHKHIFMTLPRLPELKI